MRTSSKDSSGSEGHKHAHVMFSSHLSNTIPYKDTTSASTSTSNMISDSWEAVNAKLQYEKHLQDLNDRNNNNNNINSNNDDDDGATASHHDVLMDRYNQRREFYSNSICGSNNSNSNNGSGHHDGGPHPAVVSTSHKPPHRSKQPSFQLPTNGMLRIDDIQTNFGEIVNPAPAAFSPQFTRKHYRSNDRSNVLTTSNAGDDDNESDPSIQQDTSTTSSNHFSYHQHHLHHQSSVRPKTVFIPVVATVTCDRDADADNYNNNSNNNNNITADADRSHADDDVSNTINGKHNNDKSKFLNKRAVHYNEYKVLQAMRAKMKAEEEEEEEEGGY